MKLVAKKLDISHGLYHCPWQSIYFIGYMVPPDLRWDAALDSKELFDIDYTTIFNNFKLTYYKKYLRYNIYDVEAVIDPTKLHYDGWEVGCYQGYENSRGTVTRPFHQGFVKARKEILPGLYSVSVAIILGAHNKTNRKVE